MDEIDLLHQGQTLIAFLWPAQNPVLLQQLAARGMTALSMDSVPRISRAQKMDALSSMANIGGYRAVIEAAEHFGRFFTGQITAAGRVPPAKVLVIGAGVAGLSAIGTARALGAIVRAFDTRPEVKEQVESMDGDFLELDFKEEGAGAGGYAKVMSAEFIKAEMALFAAAGRRGRHHHHDGADTRQAGAASSSRRTWSRSMRTGSVIVDLAAEQGGNCELTKPDEVTQAHGVTIIGYTDLPSRLPTQSSQLYATNLRHLLTDMCPKKDGVLVVDLQDEVVRGATVVKDGADHVAAAGAEAVGRAAVGRDSHRAAEAGGARTPPQGQAARRSVAALLGAAAARRPRPGGAAVVHGALHGVRPGLLRRLHGRLERDAGAAHAADERHQRDQQHHHHRGAAPGELGRGARARHGGRDAPHHQHQHRRRLRSDAAHARDVPEVRARVTAGLVTVSYIGAVILFILALGGLSNQETARRGNLFGIIGMAVALVATILGVVTANYAVLVGALAVGGAIGLVVARRVQMTQMPELVAILHSLVGLAAVLVGFANFLDPRTGFDRHRGHDPRASRRTSAS